VEKVLAEETKKCATKMCRRNHLFWNVYFYLFSRD